MRICLANSGLFPKEDAEKIVEGLKSILMDIEEGNVEFSVHDEDIHMNIERLTERIGDTGKRLHTGRASNDQVATDFRLYMKQAGQGDDRKHHCAVHSTLYDIAEENTDTIMTAYTHLQKAQPTTLTHYMMAYFEMFYRDIERMKDCIRHTDVLPLGAGALCATTRNRQEMVAKELVCRVIRVIALIPYRTGMFALEYLSAASICMCTWLCRNHPSTNEFGTALKLSVRIPEARALCRKEEILIWRADPRENRARIWRSQTLLG